MKSIKPILLALLAASLGCKTITITNQPKNNLTASKTIGYDFFNQTPASPEGDDSAPDHLFIHKYPVSSDGFVSGIMLLNDSDSLEEDFSLLILRPIRGGWKVIHRIDISEDDQVPDTTGVLHIEFGTHLVVKRGDLFAHWQSSNTGSIPLNTESAALEGLSLGKFGIKSRNVEEGEIILNESFSGGRDYFINLIFKETHD